MDHIDNAAGTQGGKRLGNRLLQGGVGAGHRNAIGGRLLQKGNGVRLHRRGMHHVFADSAVGGNVVDGTGLQRLERRLQVGGRLQARLAVNIANRPCAHGGRLGSNGKRARRGGSLGTLGKREQRNAGRHVGVRLPIGGILLNHAHDDIDVFLGEGRVSRRADVYQLKLQAHLVGHGSSDIDIDADNAARRLRRIRGIGGIHTNAQRSRRLQGGIADGLILRLGRVPARRAAGKRKRHAKGKHKADH